MNIELIRYTPAAIELLLSTKNTRLSFDSDVAKWSPGEKLEHLAYMKDTIKSSWEFVDYVFKIEGVTRAFTHQFVRTRTGSYAQQSMRVVDARDHEISRPERLGEYEQGIWDSAIDTVVDAYSLMVDAGAQLQDARGILPMNTTTSIIAKLNLRTLHEMAQVRMCTRTQGEYQDVFRAMRQRVIEVHPWAEDFIQVACVQNGACAFPRYGKSECPVYHPLMDNELAKKIAKERFWATRYEAAPIAKNGGTQ